MVDVAPVSPWIITDDAAGLLDFLTEVLDAVETGRSPGPQGIVGHAETVIGAWRSSSSTRCRDGRPLPRCYESAWQTSTTC